MKRLLTAIGIAGLAIFSAGLIVARLRLPEWRTGAVPPRSYFATRLQAATSRAGISMISPPRFQVISRSLIDADSDLDPTDPPYRVFGTRAADWLASRGRGPFVEAVVDARLRSREHEVDHLRVIYSLQGEPIGAAWLPLNPVAIQLRETATAAALRQALAVIMAPDILRPPGQDLDVFGAKVTLVPLAGGDRQESFVVYTVPGSDLPCAQRLPGSVPAVRQRLQSIDLTDVLIVRLPGILVNALLTLGCAALFMVLLSRRRIDLTNGAILAVLSFAFTIGPPLREFGNWPQFLKLSSGAVGLAIAIFILWSAAESWVRSTTSGFRTNLDSLRAGRIGPQSGAALLAGGAAGAAVAGLWLMTVSAATLVPGLSPTDGTVRLPMFSTEFSVVGEGVLLSGFVVLAIGAAFQLPLIRRVPFCSVILATLFLATRVPVSRFWFASFGALLIAAVLVPTYNKFGLTALLTATVVAMALPAAIYAAMHVSWLGGSLIATSALCVAPLVLGLVGMTRPAEAEMGEVRVPAFVHRLEEERRLQHEMDLLARMQLGLLPLTTPQIDGYDIAARSILATEAGGDLYDFLRDERGQLWVAAGDVSGHGYSCAIAQAMTKAGLASLVGSEQTPATVLARLDRVLRTSGSSRTFTSLALMRLDPPRGEGLIANAGHPYPLFAADGETREIQISSLPLGQGPARMYANTPIQFEPGSVIVFCSDGLFEAMNGNGSAYGFDRMRVLLSSCRGLTSNEILHCILEDWRKHIGRSAANDDTTIVVVKRNVITAESHSSLS
jgi:sigma-B regulation protein RsbU (phosphoserine phosphatase)